MNGHFGLKSKKTNQFSLNNRMSEFLVTWTTCKLSKPKKLFENAYW